MIDELDKLKGVWQAASDSSDKLSLDELKKIVRKRSRGELSKVKRKMFFEWVVSVFLSLGFIFYVNNVDPSKTLISIIYIVIVLFVSLVPYMKMMRVSYRQQSNLRDHLSRFIEQFDNLVSQYIKMYVFLIPIAIFGAYLLGFTIGISKDDISYQFEMTDVVIGLSILIAMSIIGYLILKRYFNWIYGRNMKRLKSCLKELDKVEEEK